MPQERTATVTIELTDAYEVWEMTIPADFDGDVEQYVRDNFDEEANKSLHDSGFTSSTITEIEV